MSETFITGDTHFGHQLAFEHRRKSFHSLDDMDATMIRWWNGIVSPKDTVWHVGDFALCGAKRLDEILAALDGKIRLVRGNHDDSIKGARAKRFEWIGDAATMKLGEHRAELLHYPMEVWRGSHHGACHFHGHSHGSLTTDRPKRLDVGCDDWGHMPRPVEWMFDLVSGDSLAPVDHHKARDGK